jgi:hypothetical protein
VTTLPPGRELDALVAEKVMGLYREPPSKYARHVPQYSDRDPKTGRATVSGDLRPYSTDIAAAWEVLKNIHARGIVWCIEQADTAAFPTVHIVNPTPCEKEKGHIHFIEDMERISERAESTPHAICLAALKAVGETK